MAGESQAVAASAGRYALGSSRVARMGYGAMQLRHCPDAATARAVLSRAIELGVDHIDTAEFYGDGRRSSLTQSPKT